MPTNSESAAQKYDRSKVEENDRRIVEGVEKHTRPVGSTASSKRETIYTAVTVRIRLREPKEDALREQENAVRILRREGYDAIPWGFSARSHEKPSANAGGSW